MSDYHETTVGKFRFKVATDRWYHPEGVWAKEEGGFVRIGLSDFLQQRSGDIAFVEVKPAETDLAFNDEAATIETIKVDIVLSSPVSGRVVRVNPQLEVAPEVINQDPYGEGWLCEIEVKDWESDRSKLLPAEVYFVKMKNEAEQEVSRK